MENETVREKIERLRRIRYEVEGDEVFSLSDDLASSSEFRELCLAIAEEAVERELQADAIAERVKELTDRKARLLRTAETMRNLILQCMDTKGESLIQSPTLTLHTTKLKPGITVTDESAIPARFFVAQPPKLDKAALKEAVLDDGEVIDGVSLGNGQISLSIRRK